MSIDLRATWDTQVPWIMPEAPFWADPPALEVQPVLGATAVPLPSRGCWEGHRPPDRSLVIGLKGQSGPSPSSWLWMTWRVPWKRTWHSTSSFANSVGSASVASARLPGPCLPVWPVTGSAFALLRAWWSTEPACAWSRASSTTAPTTMKGTLTRIILVPAPSHTAALGTCVWEPCLYFYLACSVILLPKDA